MIGAIPTIGMALIALPSGCNPRCRKGDRSIATATRKPPPDPIRNPGMTALMKVWWKSMPRVNRLAWKDSAIMLGGGSSTGGTWKPTVRTSQR